VKRSRPGLFPWKLFLRFIAAQVFIVLAVSLLAGVTYRNLFILITSLIGFSAWFARPLFIPLGRMLEKAREVTEGVGEGRAEHSSPAHPGEYHDEWDHLESALDRMRVDLRKKSDALAREREEIEVLMAALPEAIVAVDQESRLLFFNSQFALLFGDLKADARQTSLGEVFRTPEVLKAFRSALSEGLSKTVNVELRTRSDQEMRVFSLSVTPLRRESGPVYSAVGIFHDVTELKQAEKIRIEFVANVSHELRTPLTAIKGYTDTLASDIRSKQYDVVDKYIEVINRNSDRLMNLIEDLLDLSSLESTDGAVDGGSRGLNVSAVSTREITLRVIAQLEPRRAQKSHVIEPVFAEENVFADPRRLEQILVNLIDNAIKYVPQNGRIRVIWEKLPKSVQLRVSDNGPGIPPEYQARLFERFFRIDKARSREIGGTGLGLAIVKHIMQKHGGSVRVESQLGRGTEFICEFPEAKSNQIVYSD
jgi:two-component system phosphate regulon sensor histidine kinase PhoR